MKIRTRIIRQAFQNQHNLGVQVREDALWSVGDFGDEVYEHSGAVIISEEGKSSFLSPDICRMPQAVADAFAKHRESIKHLDGCNCDSSMSHDLEAEVKTMQI